nr:MFS transporter [Clostridium sp.]
MDSLILKIIYYAFTYTLFSTVYTFVIVPYNALVSEMSTEYKTRTSLYYVKMAFSQFSALIAMLSLATLLTTYTETTKNRVLGLLV